MKTAFLFPGQGAQYVGMGLDVYQAFPAARDIFDRSEAASNLPLKKLCFEGPQEDLARTDVCQPAIFAVSAAILAAMKDVVGPARPQPAFMAGLSLGEYTALYAAGAMDLETAVRLVTQRGRAMQAAAKAVASGMVCVLGLDEAAAERLCQAAAQGQVLVCANFNCPGQVVLSGEAEACQRVQARAEEFGASGTVPLEVAGAFHSKIMQPAADELQAALGKARLAEPKVAVVSNVDAEPYDGSGQISGKLVAQLTSPVRWQRSMEYLLRQEVETFYEIGPGRVLAGLMRRIDRKARVTCLNSREAIEKLLET